MDVGSNPTLFSFCFIKGGGIIMWPFNTFELRSISNERVDNAESVAIFKGKKGKKRKNWENQNTIWQQKKRFS